MNVDAVTLLAAPFALGLLGFVEPCSIGASLLFLKILEGRDQRTTVVQAVIFMATRAVFLGLLAAAAAVVGAALRELPALCLDSTRDALCRSGRALPHQEGGPNDAELWPKPQAHLRLARSRRPRAAVWPERPGCATPLLAGLLGAAALSSSAKAAEGVMMLAVFGLALSLPLVFAVIWGRAERSIDRVFGKAAGAPFWIGLLFVALGAWLIYEGLKPVPAAA